MPAPCRGGAVTWASVEWRTFEGKTVDLVPWTGSKVALLTRGADHDARTIARILGVLDDAWSFHRRVTGRDPSPRFRHEGRTSIAEVDGIGGAAWAWLGETGIEIRPEYLEVLVRGVRERDEFDQVLFYELGRNFWFYPALDLEGAGSVCTGFAVYLRFLAMEASGARGAPYRGIPFERFRETVLSLVDRVPAPDWLALLARAPVPVESASGLDLSTADLVASLFSRWFGDDEEALRRFLRVAASLPLPRDAAGVIANLERCAREAGVRSGGTFT